MTVSSQQRPGARSDLPSVASVIRRRLAGEPDDFVLGLAVDGGGMRGVVTGAMLIALKDLGLDQVFDRQYGTSAGAMNIALFGTGGSWEELALYYDDIAANVVKVPRPSRPVMDMEYLAEVQRRYLTEHDVLAQHGLDLRFPVTDLGRRRSRLVVANEAGEDLAELLVAGCWLPYLAGKAPVVGGDRLCDGYVLEPSTTFVAALDGCTHVLALSPKGGGRSRVQTAARLATAASLEGVATGLGRQYLKVRRYQRAVVQAGVPPYAGRLLQSTVLWLAPQEESHRVEPMSRGEAALLRGARAGYAAVVDHDGDA